MSGGATVGHDFPQWKPRANPWFIAIAVMLGTFMEVLDTSIANVALPHIAGSMAITPDQATWVLTSYLISNAIVLTCTGWLSRTFGRKRFLLTCIIIFTGASMACGLATNIGMLIVARVIQGMGGGALQPSAQAILLESFPYEKRGKAMAFYSFGVIFAPVLGPTLGGFITDYYTWRWIFFINIPVGLLALTLISALVEDPPYIKHARKTRLDFVGLALLSLWIGTLQVVLDKGQQADWLGAVWVRWFVAISLLGFLAFVAWELTSDNPLVDLRVLKNRNFFAGTTIVFAIGIVLYATTALLPLFLQTLLNYSALDSGLAVSPRGLGSIAAILIVGNMMNILDRRFLMMAGLLLLAYSSFQLGQLDMDIAMFSVTWCIILNGFATPMLFIPLTTSAVGTLKNEQIGNATSIYNLMRNIGGSFGISITTTLLSRVSQASQNFLVQRVTPLNSQFTENITAFRQLLAQRGAPALASQKAMGLIYQNVVQQSDALSFIYNFRLLAVLCVCCVPLIFLFKLPTAKTSKKSGVALAEG